MRFKILTLAAALSVLAACADKAATTAAGGGDNSGIGSTPGGVGEAPAATLQAELTQIGDRIFFSFNKSDISPESKEILTRQAKFAGDHPELTFTVEGHCDERGTREYNLALGERRATADKKALAALGVSANRLQTISYGKERPAVVGSTEEAYAQNRRAVLVIN
jgi:peptidoglycan-associated lipoprotein